MNIRIAGGLLLALIAVQTATALDIGIFASHWNHKDGKGVWGGGVLLLPASLPMEFRGTFYERSESGKLQASPLDAGLTLGLTQLRSFNIAAVGGGSYVLADAKGASPDNAFGWYAGGRLEVSVHQNYVVLGEVLYRGIKLDPVDFSGVTFNLGVMF